MPKLKLTKSAVDTKCVAEPGRDRTFYWDTELMGFGLCVMAGGTKTFVVQRDLPGQRTRRQKLGRDGELTVDQARNAARAAVVGMATGNDPVEQKRKLAAKAITLTSAIEIHRQSLTAKQARQRTIDDVADTMQRHFAGIE